MYALWVEKCTKEGYQLVVAEDDSTLVGFVAAKDDEAESVIELVAVDSQMRSRGIGYDLTTHHLKTARRYYRRAEIGVHLANVPALRLYEHLGFAVNQSELTFHRWADPAGR